MTIPADRWASQPVHSLDYWLSPELARISPPNAPSRLRELADAQGALAGAWSSAVGGGIVFVMAGAVISALTGTPVAILVLGILGAALIALGARSWKRVRSALPRTERHLVTRGPGSARGGVTMVSVLAVILGGGFATTLPNAAAQGPATVAAIISGYVLTVLLLVACIVVPSVVMGRARQSFRRRMGTDSRLRAAVENDLARWRDPYGNAGYGPL